MLYFLVVAKFFVDNDEADGFVLAWWGRGGKVKVRCLVAYHDKPVGRSNQA